MNINQIESELIKLTELKDKAKRDIAEVYKTKWFVTNETGISRIDKSFFSVKCGNFNDFKNVLKNCEPYETSHKIEHSSIYHYINSPFKFTIVNSYYKRELKFEFIKINNTKFWVSIDFNKIPNNIINDFFTETKRALYSTETVYVNIPSHYKKFKDIRIQSFIFKGDYLSWFGGDKTILSSPDFFKMLESLNN